MRHVTVVLGLVWSFVVLPVSAAGLPDFTDLIEQASPAVVKINTVEKIAARGHSQFPLQDVPEIFRDFFERRGGGEREARSMGSGFIISRDGYILTNNHVVGSADEIVVRLIDRREFEGKVIGADPRSDLALLKIEADDLPVARFAKPGSLRVGEWVVAIGSPFGLDYSASAGIVSAIGRSIPTDKGENYVPFIQSDVAINPGNSGGPLLNLDGEVVGINSQIYTRSGGSIGLSFAIPVDVALEVVDQLKTKGHVDRGWLGVYIQDVDRGLAESLGLKKPQGALVAQVEPGGPADNAGIKAGDVVIRFNGQLIRDSGDLPHVVGLIKPDTEVEAVIVREGKQKSIDVKVGELPGKDVAGKTPGSGDKLGVETRELDERTARNWRLRGGAVITQVYPDTPAAKSGLRPGDVIVQLGYNDIESLDDYQAAIDAIPPDSPVPIRIFRQGRPIFRSIQLDN